MQIKINFFKNWFKILDKTFNHAFNKELCNSSLARGFTKIKYWCILVHSSYLTYQTYFVDSFFVKMLKDSLSGNTTRIFFAEIINGTAPIAETENTVVMDQKLKL